MGLPVQVPLKPCRKNRGFIQQGSFPGEGFCENGGSVHCDCYYHNRRCCGCGYEQGKTYHTRRTNAVEVSPTEMRVEDYADSNSD